MWRESEAVAIEDSECGEIGTLHEALTASECWGHGSVERHNLQAAR